MIHTYSKKYVKLGVDMIKFITDNLSPFSCTFEKAFGILTGMRQIVPPYHPHHP